MSVGAGVKARVTVGTKIRIGARIGIRASVMCEVRIRARVRVRARISVGFRARLKLCHAVHRQDAHQSVLLNLYVFDLFEECYECS